MEWDGYYGEDGEHENCTSNLVHFIGGWGGNGVWVVVLLDLGHGLL
jgi:hypothetical protein